MMRTVLALLVVLLAFALDARADNEASERPILEVRFDTRHAIPGQSIPLQLTVLVPTWMPRPVAFPTFEIPNVRVRLPERATFPNSRRVGSETWSGVVRTYYLSPLVPGMFTIPPKDLVVTYAAPGGIEPVTVTLHTGALEFEGRVPEGAGSLVPFVAARSLVLEQELSEKTTGLSPGDGIERTITATIEGASPFSLQALMPPHRIPGVRAYADTPAVDESEDGNVLSGTRTERITLMAEAGGEGEAPAVRIRWYNLESGEIEISAVPGFSVSVIAPPPQPVPMNYGRMAKRVILTGALMLVLVWAGRRAWPFVHGALARRQHKYRDSEAWAFDRLRGCIQAHDYFGTLAALDAWSRRIAGPGPMNDEQVTAALNEIGAARYADPSGVEKQRTWNRLYAVLLGVRQEARRNARAQAGTLAGLNR